jgi:hypothetical protein
LCFDAATEGATGGFLSSPTRRLSHSEVPGDPEGYLHPSTPRRLPVYPYPSVMAKEDAVLEEAMEYLKEAGGRIRATQSLMRSEGIASEKMQAAHLTLWQRRDTYYSEGERRVGETNGRVRPADVRVLLPVPLRVTKGVSTVAQQ